MKKKNIVIIAVVAVLAILVIWFISTYNGLATSREQVDTAASNIETVLQRRADLIPNLVSTVKNLTEHEQNVVNSVTEARAAISGAYSTMTGDASTSEKLAANDKLVSAINVIVENYPEIKSTDAYTGLMDELSGSENRIAVARRDYNEAVTAYNKKVIRFPGNLVANLFGFEKVTYFEASSGAETTPNVGDLFG